MGKRVECSPSGGRLTGPPSFFSHTISLPLPRSLALSLSAARHTHRGMRGAVGGSKAERCHEGQVRIFGRQRVWGSKRKEQWGKASEASENGGTTGRIITLVRVNLLVCWNEAHPVHLRQYIFGEECPRHLHHPHRRNEWCMQVSGARRTTSDVA